MTRSGEVSGPNRSMFSFVRYQTLSDAWMSAASASQSLAVSERRRMAESRRSLSDQHQRRTLNQFLESSEIGGADGTVHHAMVATHADPHAVAGHDLARFVHHRHFL